MRVWCWPALVGAVVACLADYPSRALAGAGTNTVLRNLKLAAGDTVFMLNTTYGVIVISPSGLRRATYTASQAR